MDEDINFPNPLLRHDLPVKGRRRKIVALVLAVAVFLAMLFLPQIAHTFIGRRVVREYMAWRLGGEVALGDVRTSWFGPTTVSDFVVRDPGGRLISFRHLQTDMSLGQWLRGFYALGNAAVDKLHVDLVMDDGYGHHTTFPAFAPKVTGNLTIDNGVLVLGRSRLESGSLAKASEFQHFSHLRGHISFANSSGPWPGELTAEAGEENNLGNGTITMSGDFSPGPRHSLAVNLVAGHLTLAARNLPTAPLAWIVCPAWTQEAYRLTFGATLNNLDVVAQLGSGKLAFQKLQFDGPLGKADAPMSIDLAAAPAAIVLAGSSARPATISGALSPAICHDDLAFINPLLRYSTQGRFALEIRDFSMPLTGFTNRLAMDGSLAIDQAILTATGPLADDKGPQGLLGQLAALTGQDGPAFALPLARQRFELREGNLKVHADAMTFGSASLVLEGENSLAGELNALLGVRSDDVLVALAPQLKPLMSANTLWCIPLTGSAEAPRLDLDGGRRRLPPLDVAPFNQAWATLAAHLSAAEARRWSHDTSADLAITKIMNRYVTPTTVPAAP